MKKESISERRISEKWAGLLFGYLTLTSVFLAILLMYINQ